MPFNPIRIWKNEAEEEKAKIIRLSLFIGVIAICDLVESTVGLQFSKARNADSGNLDAIQITKKREATLAKNEKQKDGSQKMCKSCRL